MENFDDKERCDELLLATYGNNINKQKLNGKI